jgi:hypothetical protein
MFKRIGFYIFVFIILSAIVFFMVVEIEPKLTDYQDGPYVLNINNDSVTVISILGQGNKDSIKVKYSLKNAQNYFQNETLTINSPDIYSNIDSVFAVGDVHGEYNAMVALLKNNNVINSQLEWSFGKGHVVFCGDVFDRGDRVTECLWLIYRLEQEAQKVGGRVHFLLGNHEVMILNGDLRYLHKKYKSIQEKLGVSYSYLFNKSTLLGNWLRTKNTVIKINNNLYVHGGIHPDMVRYELAIATINNKIRDFINGGDYNEITSFLINNKGPLWYRGYLLDEKQYSRITMDDLEKTLLYYRVERIICAHTTVEHIKPIYEGKIIPIDVPLSDKNGEALMVRNTNFFKADKNGMAKPLFD